MNGCATWLLLKYRDDGEGKLEDVKIIKRNFGRLLGIDVCPFTQTVYSFTSQGRYYEFEDYVMNAVAREAIRKYDILPGIDSKNKLTLQDLKNRVVQLEQQKSLRSAVNMRICDQINTDRTGKKCANDQLLAQGRALQNTLQNEKNSVLSLSAKEKQLVLENKASVNFWIDLRDQCITKTKELTELSAQLIQTKVELKDVEDVVCEKKILINTKELRILELEDILEKMAQENEKVFKNLESNLANKTSTFETESKRFKRLLTIAQKSERQLRKASDRYESYATSSESESSQDGF